MKLDRLLFSNLSDAEFEWLTKSYSKTDSLDVVAFGNGLSKDASFKMGNMPPVTGKEAILENIASFWKTIKGMNHNFINVFSVDNKIILEAIVDYVSMDDSKASLPCVTIIERDGEGLSNNNRVLLI